MQIKRSVQCHTCGTNYFEGDSAVCPKCSGQAVGVARPLAGFWDTASTTSGGTPIQAAPVYDPVCGWLVCLDGENSGRYLRLFQGKNSIGGGGECMLPIDFAPGVHRGASALVLYDHAANRFWLMNAPGRDIVRINGEVLLAAAELGGGEVIQIGGASFRFVPLCGPKFRWG